ncbi:MAG: envelope integrity protein Cei [Corynebacteriales bacterium]|uniref:Envelope integrity protein Cei n=1 Tax=Williamsia herbipolensis TaxID=1603258 RepID=A0AAU4K3I8_9NOCA|nr:envelope integrity protein Cei [Williamsia herbipolensis]MCX6470932.1 envelope integrity protein Cei [Mycobacteriales bacterium]
MVSQITIGYPTDDHGRPFRRRRFIPFVIAVVVLLVLALAVWISALSDGGSASATTSCNQPPVPSSATPSGAPSAAPTTTVANSDLLDVAPGALSTFQVRVLNASAERGQARSVLDDLTSQGFTPATDTPYADDTVYPDQNLDCVGQIRFGQASRAAAAALWVAEPCAQLVDDGRSGSVVDLVLGTQFTGREQSQDAQAVLEALRQADPSNPRTGADPALVSAVHNASC